MSNPLISALYLSNEPNQDVVVLLQIRGWGVTEVTNKQTLEARLARIKTGDLTKPNLVLLDAGILKSKHGLLLQEWTETLTLLESAGITDIVPLSSDQEVNQAMIEAQAELGVAMHDFLGLDPIFRIFEESETGNQSLYLLEGAAYQQSLGRKETAPRV